jgi:hypothetical protein
MGIVVLLHIFGKVKVGTAVAAGGKDLWRGGDWTGSSLSAAVSSRAQAAQREHIA